MIRMTMILIVLGLAACAAVCIPRRADAADRSVIPIDWRGLGKGYPTDDAAQRLLALLRGANKYALTTWWMEKKKYAAQADAPYLDFGGKDEVAIRPPCEEAFSLALSLKLGIYDHKFTGIPRSEAETRTLRLIRSLAFRHRASTPAGWGGAWQSAMWASWCGQAGWLLWDKLSPTDQTGVQAMVENEADRFLSYKVPYYQDRTGRIVSPGDTKCEENAWNATILQLAVAMMPRHAHRDAWMQKNLELMVSTYARPSDVTRADVINGKPLSAWLGGSNSNEDGTLVNHNRIHPDYMVSGLFEFSPVGVCALSHQPVPHAAFFNADVTCRALTDVSFVAGAKPYPVGGPIQPPGGTIYRPGSGDIFCPQGNDWGGKRRMNFVDADVLAGAFGLDALSTTKAPAWEALHVQAALDMQGRFTDGRTYGDRSEDSFHSREEWVAQKAASACLIKWVMRQGKVEITNRAYPMP